jgi:hypothetical protein
MLRLRADHLLHPRVQSHHRVVHLLRKVHNNLLAAIPMAHQQINLLRQAAAVVNHEQAKLKQPAIATASRLPV